MTITLATIIPWLFAVVVGAVSVSLALVVRRLRTRLRTVRQDDERLVAHLQRVEGETRRLETVRRDFVANISHELRTPLASIKLLVETLESGALDDHDVALNFTHRIGEETDHLISMAEELLDLARLEAAPTMHPEALDAAAVVLQAVERMRALARNKDVALRAELPSALPWVWADDENTSRVFVNLLNNALAFTPVGGSVVVGAQAEPDTVVFTISDTGPGIPKGEEHRIFERFYKADPSRQRGGVGLGLSITRHIIAAQGGHIWARNRPDTGACFSFTLPIVRSRKLAAPGSTKR